LAHDNAIAAQHSVLFKTTQNGTIALREQSQDGSNISATVWRYNTSKQTFIRQDDESKLFLNSHNDTTWISDVGFVVLPAHSPSNIQFYHWSNKPSTAPLRLPLPSQTIVAPGMYGDLLNNTLILSVLRKDARGSRAAIMWLDDITSDHPTVSYLTCPDSFKACDNMGRSWAVSTMAAAIYSDVTSQDGQTNQQILLYVSLPSTTTWQYVASVVGVDSNAYMSYMDETMFYYHTNDELIILNLTDTLQDGNQVWLPSKPLQTREMRASDGMSVVYNSFWVLQYDHRSWSLYAVYSDPPGIVHVRDMALDETLVEAHFTRYNSLAMLFEDGTVHVSDLAYVRPINPAYPVISTPHRVYPTSRRPTTTPTKPDFKLTDVQRLITIVGGVCTLIGILVGFALRKRFQSRRSVYDLAETEVRSFWGVARIFSPIVVL
jgi:hypothetical protein